MIAKSWRKIGRLALLVAIVSMLPGAASAASPVIITLDVFGHQLPEVNEPDSHLLFPFSAPFGVGVAPLGRAWARGVASPSDLIVVTADDADPSTPAVVATTTSEPATLGDGSPNPEKGEFLVQLNVTQLGAHLATGTDKNSADPADWGPSSLTLTVQAKDPGSSAVSPIETRTLTKYAAAQFDASGPRITGQKYPPSMWCHYRPNPRSNEGNGEFPTTGNPDYEFAKFRAFLGGCDSSLGGGYAGIYPVSGYVSDETNSYASWSEIASVTITLSGGKLTAPRVFHETIFRDGPHASVGTALDRRDYPPTVEINYQIASGPLRLAPSYKAEIKAFDAWGNASSTSSKTFDVCTC